MLPEETSRESAETVGDAHKVGFSGPVKKLDIVLSQPILPVCDTSMSVVIDTDQQCFECFVISIHHRGVRGGCDHPSNLGKVPNDSQCFPFAVGITRLGVS
jgi:hypothetical protein